MNPTRNLLTDIQESIKAAGIVAGDAVFIEDVEDPVWNGAEQLNIYEQERTPVLCQVICVGYERTVILASVAETHERAVTIIKTAGQVVEAFNLTSCLLTGETVEKIRAGSVTESGWTCSRRYTIFSTGE